MSKITQTHVGCSSDIGRARDHNEDSWLCSDPAPDARALELRGRLYMVADGMGGHAAGEVASRIAVETIEREYQASATGDVAADLARLLQQANAEVHRQAQTSGREGMGTTIVCAVIRGDELFLAHIGDSRAYLLRGDGLHRLTEDHTLVSEQVRHGILAPEEAVDHPQRHVLSRALGARPEVAAEINGPIHLLAGDVLLLCSDGISGYVDEEQIAYALRTNHADPQVAADRLTELADAAGGHDNATAIVIWLEKVVPSRQALRPPMTRPKTEKLPRPAESETEKVPPAARPKPEKAPRPAKPEKAPRGARAPGQQSRAGEIARSVLLILLGILIGLLIFLAAWAALLYWPQLQELVEFSPPPMSDVIQQLTVGETVEPTPELTAAEGPTEVAPANESPSDEAPADMQAEASAPQPEGASPAFAPSTGDQ